MGISPKKKRYPINNEIKCPHCGAGTGLSNPFFMVIPPEGLKCLKCGKIVIKGHQFIC